MTLRGALEHLRFQVELPNKHARHCPAGNGEELNCNCNLEEIEEVLDCNIEIGIKEKNVRKLRKLLDDYCKLNK